MTNKNQIRHLWWNNVNLKGLEYKRILEMIIDQNGGVE